MKMISANKLNRLWEKGVVAKMVAKTKVLKTMEEISANTSAENVAGATAVKELSNKLAGFSPILDSTGRITGYKTDVGGADTVFPFSNAKAGSFVSAMGEEHIIDLGFEPSFVCVYLMTNNVCRWTYLSEWSTTKYLAFRGSDQQDTIVNIGTLGSGGGGFFSIGSIVKWRNPNTSNYDGRTVHYVAIK